MAQEQQILQAIQNIATAENSVATAIKSVFPQQTGTAATATTGPSITLPAHPVGYIVVSLPDGTLAKVAYYAD